MCRKCTGARNHDGLWSAFDSHLRNTDASEDWLLVVLREAGLELTFKSTKKEERQSSLKRAVSPGLIDCGQLARMCCGRIALARGRGLTAGPGG